MKTTFATLAFSLLTAASPALAAASSASEAGRYFAADAGVSFGALAVAAGVMAAVKLSTDRRRLQQATVDATDRAGWRNRVMRNLDADLQTYSRQLRRAA